VKLENIVDEGGLRHWLRDNCRLQLEWVEPSKYGSSVGAPDVKITHGSDVVGLELKCLTRTRKGIKWTVRPAQRRYHRMTALHGGRSAVLASIDGELVLVRGGDVPLRDYASDPDSGCPNGEVATFGVRTMPELEELLFGERRLWRPAFAEAAP
jgi:hypothetical protein